MSWNVRRFGSFAKVWGSTAATVIFVISAVVSIDSGLHKPTIKPSVAVSASGSAAAQSSSGSQSPNLNGGQRNVILYGSSLVNGVPSPALPSRAVTRQSSSGSQSPNISGISGNVEIQYGSPSPETR